MKPEEIKIGKSLLDAFNARDLSRWEAALADNVTVSYPGLRGNNDKAAAKAFNAPFLTAFSDLHFNVDRAVADGDTCVYVWTATGTHDGPLVTPTGAIPPTGRKGNVPGVLIATIKNGTIVREETYWNVMDLMAQLGLMPA